MERLTYKEGNHYYPANDCLVGISTIDEDSLNVLQNVLDKLGAYEDADEQGLLLRLPCKVGDTIYIVFHNHTIGKSTVVSFKMIAEGWAVKTNDWSYLFTDFGKTVFLTKSEAKLAEMEGERWED